MHPQSTAAAFDPSVHFLGLLCVRDHDWDGSGRSLRYMSTRQCVACVRESVRIGRERPDYHLSDGEVTLLLSRLDVHARIWAQLWANLAGNEPQECWLWQGRTVWGYGNVTLRLRGRTKYIRAHRLAYLLAHGSLPAEPLVIRHAVCGNRLCCNPQHLMAGSVQDNVDDRQRHGRTARGPRAHPEWAARGERHGQARWTDEDVEEMRRLRACGQSLTRIASTFGTTRSKVQGIVTGKYWAHVGGPLTAVGERPARGEVVGTARLTDQLVRDICRLHAEGATRWELADRFGVTPRHIYDILTGVLWKHVDCPRVYRHEAGTKSGPRASKLTAESVRQIWDLLAGGVGPTRIAEQFGISVMTIKAIREGRTWAHVAPPDQIAPANRLTSEMP